MNSAASPVYIASYDPVWPKQFSALAARVLAASGPGARRAEHVGSTAVPGLGAKRVIDLDLVVTAPVELADVIRRLTAIGYVHEGDLGIPGREAFRAPVGEPQHHLYVVLEGSTELGRHLAFRDALRTDPALRDRYAALKRAAATQHRNDRTAYSQAKTAFIANVLAEAAGRAGR